MNSQDTPRRNRLPPTPAVDRPRSGKTRGFGEHVVSIIPSPAYSALQQAAYRPPPPLINGYSTFQRVSRRPPTFPECYAQTKRIPALNVNQRRTSPSERATPRSPPPTPPYVTTSRCPGRTRRRRSRGRDRRTALPRRPSSTTDLLPEMRECFPGTKPKTQTRHCCSCSRTSHGRGRDCCI